MFYSSQRQAEVHEVTLMVIPGYVAHDDQLDGHQIASMTALVRNSLTIHASWIKCYAHWFRKSQFSTSLSFLPQQI